MYQDIIKLEKFYQSELGKAVQDRIYSKLKKYIYLHDGEKLGSFGFGEPYLSLLPKKKYLYLIFFLNEWELKKIL